jgi:ketosteroid isomerase-like protein
MKTIAAILCTLSPLLVPAAGTALAAENWTPAQQEIADVFKTFAEAEKAGNLEVQMALTAPGFTAWNLALPGPVGRAEFEEWGAAFFKNIKVEACEFVPSRIEIHDTTAVAHGRLTETRTATTGERITVRASWTASLARDGGKWLLLAFTWFNDPPKLDEATIWREVEQVAKDYLAAINRLDPDAVLKFTADAPKFCHVGIDGKQFDQAEFKQFLTEAFAGFSARTAAAQSQDIRVLDPDTAFVVWRGAVELTRKDGPILRLDPYALTCLFKRVRLFWRVVAQHESALPPRSVASPPAAMPASGS